MHNLLLASTLIAKSSQHSSLGHDIGVFFEAIGVISAVITIVAFFTGFTWQPTVKRWIRSLKLDEKIAGQEKKRDTLEGVVASLQEQIDVEVPRRAKILSVTDRMDALSNSIGDQFREYSKLESQLAQITAESGSLAPPIRQAIERAIVPRSKIREQRERQLRSLVALVLILIVLPSYLSPNTLVYSYMGTVFYASQYTRGDVFGAILLAALLITPLMTWVTMRWIAPRVARSQLAKKLVAIGATVTFVSLFLLGAILIDQSSQFNNLYLSNPTDTIGVTSILATILLGTLFTMIWIAARILRRGIRSRVSREQTGRRQLGKLRRIPATVTGVGRRTDQYGRLEQVPKGSALNDVPPD